jgi:DNA ligase-associated metallophosphoesterase
MTHTIPLTLAGESLDLRGDRTVHWPGGDALLLADLHFGKPDSFRKLGVPAAGDTTTQSLAKIDTALGETRAKSLVILGDFWHARDGKTATVLAAIAAWRERWPILDVRLVLGNHDIAAGGVPRAWDFRVEPRPVPCGPFVFAHHPEPSPEGYVLAGHLHPAIRLHGRGRQSLRLPCFWVGESVAVLPAFGGYTGLADISPSPNDRVFALAENEIIAVPVTSSVR